MLVLEKNCSHKTQFSLPADGLSEYLVQKTQAGIPEVIFGGVFFL
jgi:hypothetical protein